MMSVKKGFPNPLKDYILQLKDKSREGTFYKMLKENKNILEESMRNDNPVELYIKSFAQKKLFYTPKKGNFLNITI